MVITARYVQSALGYSPLVVASKTTMESYTASDKEGGSTMTTRDVREFLNSFTADQLEERGILHGSGLLGPGYRILRTASVQPLLDLMREAGIRRLESVAHDWFLLDENGDFRNKRSNE
jgi:hypothetical protein